MLGIQKLEHLARQLGTTRERLVEVASTASSFCEELELIDPARPEKKPRDVLNVTGDLRLFQAGMLCNILGPKHQPLPFSHGGVRGRHIKSNAQVHLNSVFGFTTDVANFYPSINHNRIYRLFVEQFRCHPDVARICTQLCTYRYHLALGLITSPILADCLMIPVDKRLNAMCEKQGLRYSRFVDDITISGPFSVLSGSYPRVMVKVLADYGFKVNQRKHDEALRGRGRFADGKCITQLEIRNGQVRVKRTYIEEVRKQLSDAARLASGKPLVGLYYTDNQIDGRIHYVRWINKGQAVSLRHQYNTVDWQRVKVEATARGLIAAKKHTRKKTIPAPAVEGQNSSLAYNGSS
jgi:RNA-directed DNA polymerase